MREIKQPENDLKEARNHIYVSNLLPELSELDISEVLVLQLHKWTMSGILTNAKEGPAGEYRKFQVQMMGSRSAVAHPDDVAPLMKRFYEKTLVQEEEEDLLEYISRVHTEFQKIHPFADGNGRVGRQIINILLMKNKYPILVLPSTMSIAFNHAVGTAAEGNVTLFTRLLAEPVFKSLNVYEKALPGVELLPSPNGVTDP